MTLSTSAVAVCCSSDSRKIACARLHLVEQPHVLDRDHRLVGEGLDQIDLFVGKRLAPFSIKIMTPIGVSFAQERDAERRLG